MRPRHPRFLRLLAVLVWAAGIAWLRPAAAEDTMGADSTAPPPVAADQLPEVLSGTLKKVRDSGSVTLGYRDASFPFSFVRAQPAAPAGAPPGAQPGAQPGTQPGTQAAEPAPPMGYSIDLCLGIVDEMRRELGGAPIRVQYQPVTSDTRIDAVKSGKADLECGSTTSNIERQKSVSFSPLIFVAGTKLLVKRSSGISSYRDLTGKTLVVTSGTTNEAAMRSLNDKYKLGITIIAAQDHQESYDALVSGKAAAFATDDVLLAGFVAANKAQDTLAVVGDFITYEPYGIMFRKDDPQMKDLVERAFAVMAQTGAWVADYHKWFLRPTPTGEDLHLPLSLQLTESLRALGVDQF